MAQVPKEQEEEKAEWAGGGKRARLARVCGFIHSFIHSFLASFAASPLQPLAPIPTCSLHNSTGFAPESFCRLYGMDPRFLLAFSDLTYLSVPFLQWALKEYDSLVHKTFWQGMRRGAGGSRRCLGGRLGSESSKGA